MRRTRRPATTRRRRRRRARARCASDVPCCAMFLSAAIFIYAMMVFTLMMRATNTDVLRAPLSCRDAAACSSFHMPTIQSTETGLFMFRAMRCRRGYFRSMLDFYEPPTCRRDIDRPPRATLQRELMMHTADPSAAGREASVRWRRLVVDLALFSRADGLQVSHDVTQHTPLSRAR